ncbi:hypothetical protein BC831DRAFT_155276 [Entophlyctis helioformis]|nr:hypothetical protein BC831DRAFT_155276 [Entophlyctis helioformis]
MLASPGSTPAPSLPSGGNFNDCKDCASRVAVDRRDESRIPGVCGPAGRRQGHHVAHGARVSPARLSVSARPRRHTAERQRDPPRSRRIEWRDGCLASHAAGPFERASSAMTRALIEHLDRLFASGELLGNQHVDRASSLAASSCRWRLEAHPSWLSRMAGNSALSASAGNISSAGFSGARGSGIGMGIGVGVTFGGDLRTGAVGGMVSGVDSSLASMSAASTSDLMYNVRTLRILEYQIREKVELLSQMTRSEDPAKWGRLEARKQRIQNELNRLGCSLMCERLLTSDDSGIMGPAQELMIVLLDGGNKNVQQTLQNRWFSITDERFFYCMDAQIKQAISHLRETKQLMVYNARKVERRMSRMRRRTFGSADVLQSNALRHSVARQRSLQGVARRASALAISSLVSHSSGSGAGAGGDKARQMP